MTMEWFWLVRQPIRLGNKYYKVKNRWGADGKFKGYFYASRAFVLYKSTNIMVHKKAIPADVLKKLEL